MLYDTWPYSCFCCPWFFFNSVPQIDHAGLKLAMLLRWLRTSHSAFTSWVLGLQTYATMPSLWGVGGWFYGLVHARQILHHLSYIPSTSSRASRGWCLAPLRFSPLQTGFEPVLWSLCLHSLSTSLPSLCLSRYPRLTSKEPTGSKEGLCKQWRKNLCHVIIQTLHHLWVQETPHLQPLKENSCYQHDTNTKISFPSFD